jgi:type IV fimbrial biogenesis protein FimT
MTTRHRERRPGRTVGVTLLETMATIAIAATLLSLGIPGLIDFTRNASRDSRVVEIVAALNYARSEAIKRNHQITLCPSSDGQACTGTNRWEAGWIVFTDPNNNGTVDGSETILRRHETAGRDGTLRSGLNRPRLTYQSSGFSNGFNTTLRVCDPRGKDHARSVVLSNTGRARVKSKADACP